MKTNRKWFGFVAGVFAVFFLTACGGDGNNDEAVNHAPVARQDTFSVTKNSAATSFDVLANDSDEDNDSLTIVAGSLTTPNHGGTVSIVSNKITYRPAHGFSGTETFAYSVTDGNASDTATVTVTVINRTPVGVDDYLTVSRGGSAATISVLSNDNDAEGDALSLVSVSAPDHGTAVKSGNAVIYTPPNDYSGDASFTYTLSDGTDTATATVNVTINRAWDTSETDLGIGEPTSLVLNNNGHALVGIDCTRAKSYHDHAWEASFVSIGETNCSRLQLALNDSDQGVAVWQVSDGNQSDVKTIRYDGSSWDTAHKHTIDYDVNDTDFPHIGIDSNGNAIATWLHISDKYRMRSNAYASDTNAWNTTYTPISTDYQVVENPVFAMSPNGNAAAVWVGSSDGTHFYILSNYYYASDGHWLGEHNVSENGEDTNPALSFNDIGDAAVAWVSSSNGSPVIQARVFRASDITLTPIRAINTDINGTLVTNPVVGIDHERNTLVVWEQNVTATNDIYFNYYDSATNQWGTPSLLENGALDAHNPKVSVNRQGDALVTWQDADATVGHLYVRRFIASTRLWSPVTVLKTTSNPPIRHVFPVLNDSGEGLVVWQEFDGSNWVVKSKAFW
jgi:hypothetical protein